MDNFVESRICEPRIAEFKAELPSLEEIESFYCLDASKIKMPEDRPYTWSNTLETLDGVVSVGQGNLGVQIAGLKRLPQAKARADFRLLCAGWAYSDVIVFSAQSLRAEKEQKLLLSSPELIRFRKDILNKKTEQPDLVVVTSSGVIDTQHPAWNVQNRKKLIATSVSGAQKLDSCLKEQLSSSGDNDLSNVEQWMIKNGVTIKVFECEEKPTNVDFPKLMKYLKHEWNVQFADVSAGPTLISLMLKAKVIDECRYTTCGQIAGRKTTGCEGIEGDDERPHSYPEVLNSYPINKTPLLEFVGIRLFGPFHVYHRGRWIYRH